MIFNASTFMACLSGRVEISTIGEGWMTIKCASGAFTIPIARIRVNEFADAVVAPKGGR